MTNVAAVVSGKPLPPRLLILPQKLIDAYYKTGVQKPVSFGTSGHRGSSLDGSFNEEHIIAITQAIIEYRRQQGITGPVIMGFDTHALSIPAFQTALEVLAANDINVVIHANGEFTPTPVISHAILGFNRGKVQGLADGIVITPSHNGPADGGFKYNPPHGGPADVDATNWIQGRANQLIQFGLGSVKRMVYERAVKSPFVHSQDLRAAYVADLGSVVDLETIRAVDPVLGVDPLGGAGVNFWEKINELHRLRINVVNPKVDQTWADLPVDWDGKQRMDCSSPFAMAGLVGLVDKFDLAFGNDPDADRHGIVCRDGGLMNPNHYLSAAISYLFNNRPGWNSAAAVGKTLVSSGMIDKVADSLGRKLLEVPVGFKWFVPGLLDGSVGFGGEESAGASFLRMDGTTWTTDKDGIIMNLLAAEMLAKTGKSPVQIYRELTVRFGAPVYKRIDGPINDKQRTSLKNLTPSAITATTVAGLKIMQVLTAAPGNDSPIGGVKIVLEDGSWFALRPSGTEPIMKVYTESFSGETIQQKIAEEALTVVFGNQA